MVEIWAKSASSQFPGSAVSMSELSKKSSDIWHHMHVGSVQTNGLSTIVAKKWAAEATLDRIGRQREEEHQARAWFMSHVENCGCDGCHES